MEDLVTGATTEVQLTVDLPPDKVWELVGDVTRIGEWSPECVGARWLTRSEGGPSTGDRYEARNEYPGGFESTVECVVVEADRPHTFAWVVLDDERDVDRPGSIWRYSLRPAGGGTAVTHTFTHGPGLTGLREGAEADPDRTAAVLAGRLDALRRNMTATLTAMTGGTTR
ncbi:MAG: SRPBCC family protein [Actinocatenispora sp.]